MREYGYRKKPRETFCTVEQKETQKRSWLITKQFADVGAIVHIFPLSIFQPHHINHSVLHGAMWIDCAEARVFLIAGALLCFGGSLYSVYVAPMNLKRLSDFAVTFWVAALWNSDLETWLGRASKPIFLYVRIPHFVFNIFLPPQKSQSSILWNCRLRWRMTPTKKRIGPFWNVVSTWLVPASLLGGWRLWIVFPQQQNFAMGSLAQTSSGVIRCSFNTRFRTRFRRVSVQIPREVPEVSGAGTPWGSGGFRWPAEAPDGSVWFRRVRCRYLVRFRWVPVQILG